MIKLDSLWGRACTTTVALAFVGAAAAAQTPSPMKSATDPRTAEVAFQISAQPIDGALREFATQARLQLIYETAEVSSNIQSQNVAGDFTPEAALSKLLVHTNLAYRIINSRTVSIRAVDNSRSGPAQATASPDNADDVIGQRQTMDLSADQAGRLGTRGKDLQTVIVTAQKRAQDALDVPISLVAVGADELAERHITTLEELPSAVPGLGISNQGNSRSIEVRGISNFTGNNALIGLYIDESDVTLGGAAAVQINPAAYDLDRVEVLRGPQGTLYGEGSAGGTIRLITKNPNLNRFIFDSEVTALFTERGGPSQRISAVANIPLIESQLGLRIASTVEHDGGWIDQPAADRKDINPQDLTNVRMKALWQPNSQLSVAGMVILNRNDRSVDWSDANTPGEWTQVFHLTTTPRVRNDYNLYNVNITYDLSPAIQILNTTTYLSVNAPTWDQGASYENAPPAAQSPPYNFYSPLQNIEDNLFTDELRFSSASTARWQWTVGGFYRHYRDLVDLPVNYFDVLGPPGTPLPAPYAYSVETAHNSWSAFGDTSYRLAERLTLGAGARYFQDDQNFTDLTDPTAPVRQTARFHSVDPRVYAQFKVMPDANVYASASKGFRSGGFNGFGNPAFGPENVWTYEFGTKMALGDGLVSFDMAVFRSNYADYQTSGTVAGSAVSYVSNAGRASIKGVESDITLRPSAGWRLDARGDYLNGRFIEINATSTAYLVGDPLDLVPRYQFTLSGQHDFSWLGRQGTVRLDYSQQGPETSRNRTIGPWYYGESDVIQILNLHTSLQLNSSLRIGFLAQNLLNDQGFANPFSFTAGGVRSRPRTFGFDFSATFE